VSASVNLPLHHKDQKFSSGTGSPGWSRKKGRKTVTVMVWCGYNQSEGCVLIFMIFLAEADIGLNEEQSVGII